MTVQLTINLIFVLVIIFFVPGLPPYTELEAVHPTPVRPLRGPLDPKGNVLNKAEKLLIDALLIKESVVGLWASVLTAMENL